MHSFARSLISSVEHIFFPHVCHGCGSELPQRRQQICRSCLASLPFTHFELHPDNPVEKTFHGRVRLEAATSLLFFTPSSLTQHLIHQFKYGGKQDLARYLGRLMGKALLNSGRFPAPDLIVPLPLHKRRETQRGYNQAALLAEGVSEKLGIAMMPHALVRDKASETQTQRTREDRWQNVSGQFRINFPNIRGNILLIDDVITTGATLDACASIINAIPGTTVSIATLAFAMK